MINNRTRKRFLATIVLGVLVPLYSILAITSIFPRGYLKPGESTGGIHNLLLIYGGLGRPWVPDDYKPYTAYLNESLDPVDSFFDGFLFMCLKAGSGRRMLETGNSIKEDWEWWLTRLFQVNGLVDNLSISLDNISLSLGTNLSGKVVIMIPYPVINKQDFGNISGEKLDFKKEEHRIEAVKWFINESVTIFQAKSYSNLNLIGFYWGAELILGSDANMIKALNRHIHSHGLKSCWIPYYFAQGVSSWKELKFDFIAYQPNYFFYFWADNNRVHNAALLAKKWGTGVEMEVDGNIITRKEEFYHRYEAYLDGAIKDGFAKGFIAYYQGVSTLKELCESGDPELRSLYDRTFNVSKMNYI